MSSPKQLETSAIEPSLTSEPSQPFIVLLVDDCLEDRETIKRYLLSDRPSSYRIFEASDAEQGLTLYQQCQPDLVLLDYQLPDSDGLEFLEQIQHSENENRPPVILLTGQGNERVAVAAMKMGVCDYLVKGQVMPDELRASINCAIENAQLRSQLRQERADRQSAEDALHQSQETIRRQLSEIESIYNTAPIGLCFVDTELRFVRINEQLAQINGLPASEHIERTLREIIPEMADDIESLFRQVIESGEPILNREVSGTNRAQPGVVRNWLSSYYPLKDGEDRVLGVNVMVQEITDRKRAEIELKISERRYASLAKLSPVGIWRGDRDGITCFYANERACEIAGLSPEEVLGNGWVNGLHPDDRDRVLQQWQQAIAENSPFRSEYRFQHADGTIRWVIGEASAETDENERVIGYIGTITDISDRKAAERSLQASEERLRLATEAADLGMWFWDLTEDELVWTTRCKILFGLAPNTEITYERFLDALHPDDRDRTHWAVTQAIQEKVEYNIEYRTVWPDGTVHWIAARGQAFYNDCGEPIRMMGTAQDISDRKFSEEALRASEEQLKIAQQSANAGLWDWDILTNKIVWSNEYYELYGLEPSLQSSYENWFASMYELDRPRIEREVRETIENRNKIDIEFRIIHPLRGLRWLNALGDTLYSASGQPIRMTGITLDVTERKLAQERLRESQELLQLGMQVAGFALAKFDYAANTVELSPEAAALYGLPASELVVERSRIHATFHPEDREELARIIERVIAPTGPGWFARDHRVVWSNGEVRWLSVRKQVFFDRESLIPRPIYAILAAIDISEQQAALRERKRAEEQLRESNAILNAINQGTTNLIYAKDRQGRVLMANPATIALNGKPEEEILGHTDLEFFSNREAAEQIMANDRLVMETGRVQVFEEQVKTPSGERIYLSTKSPYLDEAGNVIGLIGVSTEITERKRAEENLRESEEFIRSIFNSSPDCIKILDVDGNLISMNLPGMCLMEIDDFSPFVGQGWTTFWKDEEHQAARNAIAEARANRIGRFQGFCPTAKGTPKWWDVIVTPVVDVQGRVVRLVSTSRDITDRKEAELQLQQQTQKLIQLNAAYEKTTAELTERNQELDRFTHTVSHDLKAPLRAISNLSEWIEEDLEGQLSEENQQQMKLLRQRVARMEALINGLLAYSRIGRTKVASEMVDVGALICEIIDSLAPPPTFTISVQLGMPAIVTKRLLLSQVFSNLISNAIKHCDRIDGRIEIQAIQKGKYYEFFVADNGPGIALEDRDRIFGIFETLKGRDAQENTGIGLSIVKKIIETEGGEITVESELGSGATFRFTWPNQ